MRISLIVAVAENGIIGRDGGLPWRLSSDLKTFRRITMGKPIIMGRKTFETLKKPLDGRTNIVVTRNTNFAPSGVVVSRTVEEALKAAELHLTAASDDEVVVIGGAEIYAQTLPLAERIYLTEVHAFPDGDTTFPALDKSVWRQISAEPIDQGPRDDHTATLRILDRVRDNAE